MTKIWLVVQREFLSRVKKKSFLIATLLTPLIFPAILGVFVWIAQEGEQNKSLRVIEVVDENNFFFLESSDQYAFSFSGNEIDRAKEMVVQGDRYGFLYIPKFDFKSPMGITFYGEENPSMSLISYLENNLKKKIEDQRLFEAGIDPKVINEVRTKLAIASITLDEQGSETVTDATVNYILGFTSGILIYIFIFVYGNQIMQGVIEEKSSRIVEILVSSLKPFQLMMGKIIGIGAVGLTQFLIWVILIFILSSVMVGVLGMQMPQHEAMGMASPELAESLLGGSDFIEIVNLISGIDFLGLILSFIFYFIGGYLLYGSLFAAIGAAVDSPSDAQQFMLPVTIPLIVAYMGLFVFVLDDPTSTVSFWFSIIPLTSPIAMMGRVSFGVPWPELLLSMSLLVGGFLMTTWMAGKIYRIGILMHGTKPSYKTLIRWIFTKD